MIYLFCRFCCSLDEKLRELPDFDPEEGESGGGVIKEVDVEVVGWFDGFGFWSWLIISSMSILLFGLIIYMASCVFVEVHYKDGAIAKIRNIANWFIMYLLPQNITENLVYLLAKLPLKLFQPCLWLMVSGLLLASRF